MDKNQEKNKAHYEELYSSHSISNTLYWVKNLDSFLATATSTETSWYGMYQNNFRERIKGKKVLEMGCGDCTNAAVMAALGAEVYANDIADASGDIIRLLNENYTFEKPIVFVPGDFLENDLPSESFDFVIGKAFLHHLTLPVEEQFIKETCRLLKPEGEARFFEPAVNSKVLDTIRWYIPVKGRPSKFDKQAYNTWKENDPHPARSFSSEHWESIGSKYFKEVQIIPVGTIERFNKFLRDREKNIRFRQWALKVEGELPAALNRSFARSQLIVYKVPRD